MLLPQVGSETTRLGINLLLDGATIGMIITNIFLIFQLKKKSGNPTPENNSFREKPGFGKVCVDHQTKLATVETKVEGYEADVKEIKEAISEIRTYLLPHR